MKKDKGLVTKFLLLLLGMMSPFVGGAQQFKVNDIWYSIVSSNTAAVISDPYDRGSYLYIDPISIPSTVTYNKKEYSVVRIEEGAFMDRGKLSSITIPESITSIGRGAFAGCSPDSVHISSIGFWYKIDFNFSTSNPLCSGRNLYLNGELVTELLVPDTITEMKNHVFEGCISLKSIVLPESITNIGDYAFKDCSNLTAINIPEGVAYIGNYSFYGCSNLATITLPNTIKGIGWNAFQTCSSLTSINIPDNVTWIGEKAFLNCKSLSTVTLPKGITNLGDETFRNCSNLTSINIPENITKIGVKAFEKCEKLSIITIPEGMACIGNYAFSGCIGLSEVKIPEGIVTIGNSAFDGCSNLASIVLESSKIEGFRPLVFANCSKLQDVYCYLKTIPSSSTDAFKGSNVENATLHVPAKALINYKAVSPWNRFGKIEPLETIVVDITLNQPSAALTEGESLALTATIAPEDADDKSVTWSSSDENVATVDSEGKVTAVAPGIATIIATANDGGGASATCEVAVSPASYIITFLIDGEVFASDTIVRGMPVCMAIEPQKEGYTFSGWGEVPEIMPAHDVVINASFTINKYLVTFKIGDEVIAADSLEYASKIVVPEAPVKEGHTFNGWGEVAETVPANDLTYEGSYTINSYLLAYTVDGEIVQADSVVYGTAVTALAEPEKEGYTFSGWIGAPETMPAYDVTINGTFTINKYLVTFKIGDEVIASDSLEYGAAIVAPDAPAKEGYTFNGWGDVAETVPAGDVTYESGYTVNVYNVYYYVGEELVHTAEVAYGEAIPEYIYEPTEEGCTFLGWVGESYDAMPAHDVTYTANIDNGIDQFIIDNSQLAIYDLTGRRVLNTENLKGGIYIVNGRKVIVK